MARIHVSVFGGGLFDTKYTTVYLYLVRFDSESVRRLKEKKPFNLGRRSGKNS